MTRRIRDKTIDVSRNDDRTRSDTRSESTRATDGKRANTQTASSDRRSKKQIGDDSDPSGRRAKSASGSKKRSKPKRSALNLIVLLVLLIGGGVFVWREMEEQFPSLPEGTYLGVVSGVFSEDGSDNTPILISTGPTVTKFPSSSSRGSSSGAPLAGDVAASSKPALKLILIRQGWEPIDVALTASRVLSGALPILIQGHEGQLKFSGKGGVSSGFNGTVKNLTNGNAGSWKLQRVDERIAESTGEDLRAMLSLKAELIRVEERVKSLSQIINDQEIERRDLDAFLSQDPQHNSEYQAEAQEKLSGVQRKLKDEQDKLAELNNKLQLAQKLSPSGKLYVLSHGVLEKEGELIDLILQGQMPVAQDPEEMDLIKKGEEVLRIRREIELEREKIRQLLLAGETDLRQFE